MDLTRIDYSGDEPLYTQWEHEDITYRDYGVIKLLENPYACVSFKLNKRHTNPNMTIVGWKQIWWREEASDKWYNEWQPLVINTNDGTLTLATDYGNINGIHKL